MGVIIEGLGDLGYEHEGYVGHVLKDGALTGTYSAEIDPQKTGKLKAACACGWSGERTWVNDDDDPAGFASEELESKILAAWESHVYALVEVDRDRDITALVRRLRGFTVLANQLDAAEGLDRAEVLVRAASELKGALALANAANPLHEREND